MTTVDAAPFTVRTSAPQRNAALIGIGANVTFSERLTLFLDYDAQIGQADYYEHNIKAGVRVKF